VREVVDGRWHAIKRGTKRGIVAPTATASPSGRRRSSTCEMRSYIFYMTDMSLLYLPASSRYEGGGGGSARLHVDRLVRQYSGGASATRGAVQLPEKACIV